MLILHLLPYIVHKCDFYINLQRGEGLYTVFISYRVFSDKLHAALLYDALNNTVTPAGHRVIVYLDVRRLVKGEDWEQVLNELLLLRLKSVTRKHAPCYVSIRTSNCTIW